MATQKKRKKRERRYTDARQVIRDSDEGFKSAAFKVPEGMSIFKFAEERTYRIDIIPFVVGAGNPHAEEGFDHFERTYYAHRRIGPNNQTYVCPAKTFGKKCPVCDHRTRIENDADGDTILADKLKPQQRKLWLVYDYDDADKGIQIMDTAHYKSFGELLHNKVKAGDDEDGFENFFHLEDGLTLKVTCEEATFDKNKYIAPINIEMRPRKKPLPSALTDDVPCLDELLVELTYKELKDKLNATPVDDEEEEEETEEEGEEEEDEKPAKKPGKKPSKKPVDEEEEEAEVEEDEEEGEATEFEKGDTVKGEYKDKAFTGTVKKLDNGLVHVITKAGNLRVMDPDELTLVSKAEIAEEEEGEDEEESPKKPSKPSKPISKKPSKPAKDEEEEEEDEDEKPAKKPGKKPSKKPVDEEEEEEEEIPFEEEDEEEVEEEEEEAEEEEEE